MNPIEQTRDQLGIIYRAWASEQGYPPMCMEELLSELTPGSYQSHQLELMIKVWDLLEENL